MTQGEVMEFLEKHKGEWFTTKEIKEALNSENCFGSFHDNLATAYKSEVNKRLYGLERKNTKGRGIGYKWRIKG